MTQVQKTLEALRAEQEAVQLQVAAAEQRNQSPFFKAGGVRD